MWIAYAHYATDTFIVSVAYTTYVSFCHGHNYSCNEMLVKFHRKNVRLMSGHGWVSDRALNLSDLVMTLGVAKPKKQKQLFLVFCFRPKTLACLSTTKTYLTHKIVGPNILNNHVTCPWKVKQEVIGHGQAVFWMGFEFPDFDFKKVYNILVLLKRLIL